MNLNIQDFMTIAGLVFACSTVPIGFMWYHFSGRLNRLEDKLETKIDNLDLRLTTKLDGLRDRVSHIEGQLSPAKVIHFEEEKPKKKVKGE